MKTKIYIIIALSCVVLAGVDGIIARDFPWYLVLLAGFFYSLSLYKRQERQKTELVVDEDKLALEQMFTSFVAFVGKDALEDHLGGYFAKVELLPKCHVFHPMISIGNISSDKQPKYRYLAYEKPSRLFTNLPEGHLSTYESRDTKFIFPQNNQPWGKWGGAILINDFTIYAFSGFPELLDEAFVCWVAWHRKELDTDRFKVICERRANNPFLQKIYTAACSKQI
ncbi:MAG: hypothetical protein WC606_04450 [Candidatus Absconditabacterales bacterium]|jgi:hypothetical protein